MQCERTITALPAFPAHASTRHRKHMSIEIIIRFYHKHAIKFP